jgi:hypothetical protein
LLIQFKLKISGLKGTDTANASKTASSSARGSTGEGSQMLAGVVMNLSNALQLTG